MNRELASLIGEDYAKKYRLDRETAVFRKVASEDINYSDGDDAEIYVKTAIGEAEDRSLFSEELAQRCVDWPSLYHLSPIRSNILRPFESVICGAKVLEIGSGCGAITRYLGETGATTLALEGTARRAAITRSRVSDLTNVTVVSCNFSEFETSEKFDVITLIGVLEYASLYSEAEDAALAMIEKTRDLLASNGCLIIAIENKLGLKYFAGSLEDHLGEPMIGLEGRYCDGGVETFGLRELKAKLISSGLTDIDVLLPFPDYKFPSSIVNAAAVCCEDFDASAFAWQSVKADPQLTNIPLFSLEAAWREVNVNGLTADLSNSLMFVAKRGSINAAVKDDVLAWHFSSRRRKEFFKTTTFERTKKGKVEVAINVNSNDYHQEGGDFIFSPAPLQDYFKGDCLLWDLIRILNEDGWTVTQVTDFFRVYQNVLFRLGGSSEVTDPASHVIHGDLIDAVPHNLIRMDGGRYEFIDREWRSKQELTLPYMIFRTMINLAGSVSLIGKPSDSSLENWKDLCLEVFNQLFGNDANFDGLIKREVALVNFTTANLTKRGIIEAIERPFPIRKDLKGILHTKGVSYYASDVILRRLKDLEASAEEAGRARQIAEDSARISEEARLRAEQFARVSEEARIRAEDFAVSSETARVQAEVKARINEEARLRAEAIAQVMIDNTGPR